MNQKIRIGTFETNSSSVHALHICDADMYNKWRSSDDILFNIYDGEIVNKDECIRKHYDDFKDDYEWHCNNCKYSHKIPWDELTEEEKNNEFLEYLKYNCSLYTCEDLEYLSSIETEEFKDENSNDKIAISIYMYDD